MTVTATPVIRARMPTSITVRAAARRSTMIATTAEAGQHEQAQAA
jgi:hypothetical protein